LLRRELPWWEPSALARALAHAFGAEGLVLLDGDGGPLGRRAVLGVDPLEAVCCRGLPGGRGAADPFEALRAMGTHGGPWLGWLAYEAAAWLEPCVPWRDPEMASLWAVHHDPLIHFDRASRGCWLEGRDPQRLETMASVIAALPSAACRPMPAGSAVGEAGEPAAESRLREPAGAAAQRPVPLISGDPRTSGGIPLSAWQWHTSPQRYAEQVAELLQRIAAGDLFQANLTACCETWLEAAPDPLALWERLSRACPAPFAGVAIGSEGAAGEAVISASPERFLQLGPGGLVETRPIKGTRPRSADAERDAAAAAELVCDPKDRAENVMIVDLLRNDLGRVCEPGSIAVPQLVGLESYAQVHHLTSVVTGQLAPGRDVVDLLRACWPGGSISGAPKLRACTRLHGLEPVPRGPYCGSLFHWDAAGGFDSSILIRSVMASGRRLRVHAGGGIVADSDPAAEAEEMGWKIQPLLEALA
jgi:para-aminobenzoate synthetase component 1